MLEIDNQQVFGNSMEIKMAWNMAISYYYTNVLDSLPETVWAGKLWTINAILRHLNIPTKT